MDFQDIYMKNYEILSRRTPESLVKYYLETDNAYLKVITKNVLINEDKFANYNDEKSLYDFISTLNLSDLKELAKSSNSMVRLMVKEELSDIMHQLDENNYYKTH